MARWKDYQPTKGTLVWSFVGGIVATLIVGFAVFDWRTAGSAEEMALDAEKTARAELASAICVDHFMAAPDAAARLEKLIAANSWNREDMIAEGGWTAIDGVDEPVEDAADLCADALVEIDMAGDAAGSDSDVKVN
jgi:hypothetical protein